MKVYSIMATKGRHYCAERALKFFMDQDYQGEHTLLIYNNSVIEQALHLPDKPSYKKVSLINKCVSDETGDFYKNLGQIYRDAIKFVPDEIDIINFFDDDDLYLTNHISEGVKGYKRALAQDKIAYKPKSSYYRSSEGVTLTENTLEPSIFVSALHVKKYKFSDTTTEQHLSWVNPLNKEGKILVDTEGTPTLIYNWGDNFPTWKTSGDPHNPKNFQNYENFSQDHGDRIICPINNQEAGYFYNLVNK